MITDYCPQLVNGIQSMWAICEVKYHDNNYCEATEKGLGRTQRGTARRLFAPSAKVPRLGGTLGVAAMFR
jgi:hypothetical protein